MGKSKKNKKHSQVAAHEDEKARKWVLGVCLGLVLIAILFIVGFALSAA